MKLSLKRFGRALATKRRARELTNHTFSLISNTCVGGVITHNVGEQFRSPTVNLIIYEDQFLMFCQHLREYSVCPVEQPTAEEQKEFSSFSYPIGKLRGRSANLPDINLLFVHYKSFEEAKEKWQERFQRINFDNIYIAMDRGMDAKDQILDAFYELPYEHKVFFTHKEDPLRWPDNFKFSFYTTEHFGKGNLYSNIRKGAEVHHWMDEFDYVQWLNNGTIQRTDLKVVE